MQQWVMQFKMFLLFLLFLLANGNDGCSVTDSCTTPSGDLTQGRDVLVSSVCSGYYCSSEDYNMTACPPNSSHLINDNNIETVWISETDPDLPVSITLNLESLMILHSITIHWESATPGSMILEKSNDNGINWSIYRYWSTDCINDFNLESISVYDTDVFNGIDPICTDTDLSDIPGSEVTFSVYSHDFTDTSYQTVTNIRLSLVSLNESGGADNCTLYFAISEIYVNGSCHCNGRAENCRPLDTDTIHSNKIYSGCECHSRYNGTHCQECQDGYYDLSSACTKSCTCNEMGSLGRSCSLSGDCYCKPNITGQLCSVPSNGYYYRSLDYDIAEAEYGSFSMGITGYHPINDKVSFSGKGFARIPSYGGTVHLTIQVDKTAAYLLILRYSANNDVYPVQVSIQSSTNVTESLQCINQDQPVLTELNSAMITLHSYQQYNTHTGVLCLEQGITYNITVKYAPITVGNEWLLDSVVLRPDQSDYINMMPIEDRILVQYCLPLNVDTVRGPYCDQVIFNLSLLFNEQVYQCETPNFDGITSNTCDAYGGSYTCQSNYTGRLCTGCTNGYYYDTITGQCLECPVVCNSTGSVNIACDSDTGLCQCKNNVMGLSCDQCPSSSYSFNSSGCINTCPCVYGSCNDTNGHCTCAPRVTGDACDMCMDDSFSISSAGCLPCDCNPRGSLSISCNETTGQCSCINDAIGRQCNDCPTNGYYKTQGNSQRLCKNCFCFSHSQSCQADNDGFRLSSVQSNFTELCSSNFYCFDGWSVLDADNDSVDLLGSSSGISYLLTTQNNPKLIAPDKYYGNFHLSYGLNIIIQIVHTITPVHDGYIWITGSNSTIVYKINGGNELNRQLIIPLTESYWRLGNNYDTSIVSTQYQLISVLINITDIRYTARYTSGAHFNHVQSFVFQTINDSINGETYTVESCNCPTGHTGQFCDECMDGYYRPSGNPLDACIQCACNGYSTSCNQLTGVCNNCTNSTEGDQCERCTTGYYSNGVECLPCTCPTIGNSYSKTCLYINETVHCDACQTGYTGSQCQECQNGYYRDQISGDCVQCECNDNVDAERYLSCNATTGQCINCLNNTEGDHCEQCKPGYYGNIPTHPCQPCECNTNGTLLSADPCIRSSTFQTCICKLYVTGSHCTMCIDGYYGDPANGVDCIQCPCPTVENSHSNSCHGDGDNVICDNCEKGYVGERCEICDNGYYGNATIGSCIDCKCNNNFDPRLGSSCDTVTGHCTGCTNNTVGTECQFCITGYYGNVEMGIPCRLCDCNTNATESDVCDRSTGGCWCNPNVSPHYGCNRCDNGYYGDPANGGDCFPCTCNNRSDTCYLGNDGTTGICDNCVVGYAGDYCEVCDDGYYNKSGSCTPCDCNGNIDPSLPGISCDTNGVCIQCLNNTTGDHCDICVKDYYGNPSNGTPCQVCTCSANGTTSCDNRTGECECKAEVTGTNCSMCMDGYWGTPDTGCLPCNCCNTINNTNTCDRVTGQCPCYDDTLDRTCCNCIHGYYNYTIIGCTKCNCGELSVSDQCNDTGHCQCMPGGIGKTCDACETGYRGIAPNCTICEDCHFSWSDTCSSIESNITDLFNRIHEILSYYEDYSATDISNIINNIETTLALSQQILMDQYVDGDIINNITNLLTKISENYTALIDDIAQLNPTIIAANQTLRAAELYVNMIITNGYNDYPVNDLYNEMQSLNNTLKALEEQSITNYTRLVQYRNEIEAIIASIRLLQYNGSVEEGKIVNASTESTAVLSLVLSNTRSFSNNISVISTTLNNIEVHVVSLENGVNNSNRSYIDINNDVNVINEEISNLSNQLSTLRGLTQILTESANNVQKQSKDSLQAVQTLMDSANNALIDAQSLLDMINMAQDTLLNSSLMLTQSDTISTNISRLQIPSTDTATQLASNINNTIISDAHINDIINDANNSVAIARQTLDIAINSSLMVQSFQSNVSNLLSLLDETRQGLQTGTDSCNTTTNNINLITDTLNEVNDTIEGLTDTDELNMRAIDKETELRKGEGTLYDALVNATILNDTTHQISTNITKQQKLLQGTADNATIIKEAMVEKLNRSMTATNKTSQLLDTARELNNTANAVRLQRLKDLLAEYRSKVSETQVVRSKIEQLQDDLTKMTTRFKEAMQKYQKCYKTP